MLLDDYQRRAREFRLNTYSPEAAVMGLLSESGEIAGVFQKLIRGDFSPDVAATKLAKEIGDVLWHLAAVADDNGWALADLATTNLEKLESRKIRNVIVGAGDER